MSVLDRKTSRRDLLRMAAAAALAGAAGSIVSACAAPAAPSQGEAPASGQASTQEPVTITYWDWWPMTTGPAGRMFEALPAAFAQVEPNIELNLQNVPFGEYFTKFMAAHAAGDVPDVLHSSVDFGRAFFDRGAIIDLTPFIETTATMARDQFLPGALHQATKGAAQYGVPGEGPDHDTIFYNTDYFAEAGLPTEREAVMEWNWNDFTEAAAALAIRDGDGNVTRSGFLVPVPGHHELAYWAGCQGGSFYNEDETGVAFHENNGAVDGLNWWLELQEKVSQPLTPERQDYQQFLQGTTAMMQSGPWSYAQIAEEAPDLNWSAMLIPAKPVEGGQISTSIWNNMLVMPTQAKDQNAGWAFLTYWCGLEWMLKRLEIGSWMAPRKDFYETSEYKLALENLPVLTNVPLASEVGTSVAFIENTATQATINPILEAVMIGERDPESAVAEMVEKCNEILAKAGYS
jgi:multiple sugar transport system substrate-binding protein